ncbi:MAG: PQQ-dependent sugar dehydrogenase [Phycisphaerales bacterium]
MGRSVASALAAVCVLGAVAVGQPDLGNLQEVATGLSAPLYAAHPPGDSSRLFIVEQSGKIRLMVNGVMQGQAFIDVGALLTPNTGTIVLSGTTYSFVRGSEQGLLGLAFPPDYATSGVCYAYFVGPRQSYGVNNQNQTATDLGRSYLIKITRSDANDNVATNPLPSSIGDVDVIFQTDQPFTNHNGGCLQFGPDGMLYLSLGDGGSGNDPLNAALNPNNILGKLLRLDVSRDDYPADPAKDYGIPSDNPYASGGGLPEIWARGLRNSWRYSFDRVTGDLWIGDVGQNVIEEVNWVPGNGGPGRNYGWRFREGDAATGLSTGGFDVSNLTGPVYTYTHGAGSTQGYSLTGGYVYRGTAIPKWRGRYFFTDYVNRRMWSGKLVNGVFTDFQDHYDGFSNLGTTAALRLQNVASFGEDPNGELYIVQLNGRVRKLVADANQPCPADFDDGSGVGHPDFAVTIDDLLYYLGVFQSGALEADMDDGSGTGAFDNAVTIDDLLYFIGHFQGGC